MEDRVAISYAWENDEYQKKIIGFANMLRDEGYNAVMDEILKQKETSADLNELMSKMITESNKVIVVLSENYKQRADSFEGGVGAEYRIILHQIKNEKTKYIFITFDDMNTKQYDEITPTALGNVEVISINETNKNWHDCLFAKLSDKPRFDINDVATEKTIPISKHIGFAIVNDRKKQSVKKNVRVILDENEQNWKQYGPDSATAINNPLSNDYSELNRVKKEIIIPNNQRIIELIEDHLDLFSEEEIHIFKKFKMHADMFKNNQKFRHDNSTVTTFPKEFKLMIYEEEK